MLSRDFEISRGRRAERPPSCRRAGAFTLGNSCISLRSSAALSGIRGGRQAGAEERAVRKWLLPDRLISPGRMTGKSQTLSFQLPAVVQPTVDSHIYPFGNGISSDSDVLEDDVEVYELRPRGREKTRRSTSRERMDDIVFITKDIQEGDTLNALALQYCCSVADIKRVNNLITDQDFFALRTIKIPVKKFSLLTETHCFPKNRQNSRSASSSYSAEFSDASLAPELFPSTETAGNFLKEVDRDIEQIVKCNATKRENLNEVVSALSTQQLNFEPDGKSTRQKDPYYGADWGIGWWTAVVIMVVVGIITPVFYLLYYEVLVKVDVSHHSTVEYSLVAPSQ